MKYEVPLIPQTTTDSCWAASAAMILSWKGPDRVDPKKLAYGKGYAKQYNHGLGTKQMDSILKSLGLAPEPPKNLGTKGYFRLLQTYGPLWITGFQRMSGGSQYATHSRVVAGMDWNPDPKQAVVYINDPWDRGSRIFGGAANKGSKYSISLAKLREDMEDLAAGLLAKKEPFGVFVAHLPLPYC